MRHSMKSGSKALFTDGNQFVTGSSKLKKKIKTLCIVKLATRPSAMKGFSYTIEKERSISKPPIRL